MKEVIIISGGNINSDFALSFLKKHKESRIIAADRGMEFCYRNNLIPREIIGDFDSGNKEILSYYETCPQVKITYLNPVKDDSDTQSALKYAADQGAGKVWILGATGNRLDHVAANPGLLYYGDDLGMQICMIDSHNYITLIKDNTVLQREEQFGDYVSFFALEGKVEGLTLRGFKYPLTNHCLQIQDAGLTVSNEIVEETARVSFTKGRLLMVMSRD